LSLCNALFERDRDGASHNSQAAERIGVTIQTANSTA
jgi:hypothetical protein